MDHPSTRVLLLCVTQVLVLARKQPWLKTLPVPRTVP